MIKKIGLFLLTVVSLFCFSQTPSKKKATSAPKTPVIITDSIGLMQSLQQTEDRISPQKAALYSAVFPGLGQIYNKKYIKAAAVWALIGTGIGFINYYHKQYRELRNGYINKLNDPNFKFRGLNISAKTLARNVDNRQRSRDYAILLTVIGYALNIVDATVDAHLNPVRKDPDLKLSFAPVIINNDQFIKRPQFGIGLKLKF